MRKCWVLVATKKQVGDCMTGSFVETDSGKSNPLRRMQAGDGIIYYSPKLIKGNTTPYQRFSAIGYVTGETIYRHNNGTDYHPHRREVKFLTAQDTPITPLINRLEFIKDKTRWGNIFKFPILRISVMDFKLIATLMLK